jgi:hypothetical protein
MDTAPHGKGPRSHRTFDPRPHNIHALSTLVSACPLKPPSAMPDIVLAWRVNPLPELYEIISLARAVASSMYAG